MDTESSNSKGKSAGQNCCFYGCNNTSYSIPSVSLHQFPDPEKDLERYNKWVAIVRKHRDDWSPPTKIGANKHRFKNTKVCSDHFEKECFKPKISADGRPRLKHDAVPTICWSSYPTATHEKRKTATSKRTLIPLVSK